MLNVKVDSEISETKIVDQIRCLGIDMIDAAKSGHPGIVLGAAPIIYTLFAHHLRIDPKNPKFFNRDRFILSAGHGSALLYSTLYFSGYDLSLEDLKNFRQIDSITPGHPEYGVTPGVDMSTGPLGQGIATAVGMALAEAKQEALLNTEKNKVIDYYTYVLCGDGDLMEGVSYEACSLAGTLKLNKLIVLYDSNDICLDGETNKTFKENIGMRFVSQGWNVITVSDGENIESISNAIKEAKKSTDKPTLIEIKTVIGRHSVLQGTNKVHGAPLSKEDISSIKEKLGIRDIPFTVSQNCIDKMQEMISERCSSLTEEFEEKSEVLEEDKKSLLYYFMGDEKAISISNLIYEPSEDGKEATRVTSHKILNSIVATNKVMFGGSADLFGANKTYVDSIGDFSASNREGGNIFFGVREHAMGAIMNGLALCGFRSYGSTFLAFSDYMKPSIRMACMMNLPVIYFFSHDSISVGEDGPTHQPIEQLSNLRSIPNLDVFRPADANETIGAYKTVLENNQGPSAIVLARNSTPILETAKVNEVSRGGYVIYDSMKKPDGIIISSGEEVSTSIEVAKRLQSKGIQIRVVSMPNLKRFLEQDDDYIESVIPVEVRKIVVEAGTSYIWSRLVFNSKYIIALDTFGASGPKDDVYRKYGFDVDTLEEKIENLLK
ncbi:MAG: transketolase [Bacilli bacterium]|nr:transketolase [Bacilli bacterium]